MSADSKEWSGSWHRHEDSSFEARITGFHEGPIDFTNGVYQVEVSHESGRLYRLKVAASESDVAGAIVCHLVDADETFLHPDAIASLTKAMSLSTMPVIRWDGYVE